MKKLISVLLLFSTAAHAVSFSGGHFTTGAATGGAINPTVQKFTVAGTGTYTTPANVTHIRVRMVGGGGGGSGSGSSGAGNGGTGGTTYFRVGASPDLLVANGGTGGTFAGVGGAGGSASLGTGPIGSAITGGNGTGGSFTAAPGSNPQLAGGVGGATVFGGAGNGGHYGKQAGGTGSANTGAGGGGASTDGTGNIASGSGGGSGGFVDAIILSPAASYSYNVGIAGTAGTLGTNGAAGGAGAAGYIEITEYYANSVVGSATNVTGTVAVANGGTGQTTLGAAQTAISVVKQQVRASSNSYAGGTTTIPLDDTIPQNTEGTEFLTVSITPTSASSRLDIEVVMNWSHSVTGAICAVALFQDSTASALAASWATNVTTNSPNSPFVIRYSMTAGTTSSTTFKVRGGGMSAGTFQMNGASGARYLGGGLVSSITVTEYGS